MNKCKKGFSLMELIVVLGVMSIICVIAVPKYLQTVEDSKKSRAMIDAKEVYAAAETLVSQNSKAPTSEEVLAYANAKGKIRQLYFDTNNGNAIEATSDKPFVYAEDDYTVQYADGEWIYLEHYLGNSYTMKTIENICVGPIPKCGTRCGISLSNYNDTNGKLKNENINFEAMGIKSWWVMVDNNDANKVDMFFTPEEVDTSKVGYYLFIHYDCTTKKYSVTPKKYTTQNHIPEGGDKPYTDSNNNKYFDSYDDALKLYESITGKSIN